MGSLFTLLPTKMISKSDINGVKIDYEEYLTELLNASMYFMSLTSGNKFERILDQSHGEADVIANGYELDFKLLVHQEFVNAKLKSLPNVDYSNIKKGFICVNDKPANENNLTQAQSNGLFIKFLQILALAKADQIKSCEKNKEHPLYSTIKMVKKDKNLLLFLPCKININSMAIPNTVAKFLSSLFSIRDSINKDTFVTLLGSDDYFYILKYENRTFQYVDKVHKIFVTSFNDVYRLTYFLESD